MRQYEGIKRARRNALWIFAVASLLAVSLGAIVMAQAGVPISIWIRNPIAWLAAAGIGMFFAKRGWIGPAILPIAVVIVALCFLGPGQDGVHRWLDLGPVQFNAAALVLPSAIVVLGRSGDTLAATSFVLIAAMLAWQPDISQLAGFSLAALLSAATLRYRLLMPAAFAIVAAAAIAVCLSRPDPLAPVAHVEGIVSLAWSLSPALAIGLVLSLAAAALSPLSMWLTHPLGRVAPLALTLYLVVTGSAFLFGAYPVPLAGYGLSFVIGWWLAIAALVCRQPSSSPARSDLRPPLR